MSTHDYVIANDSGANVRSDLNNALAAIVSNNSSATAPATTYAYQWWADTANDLLKQRNAANSAWINILTLSTGEPASSDVAVVTASQAEMEAGTETALRSMSPQRVKQAIDALATGSVAYGLFRKTTPTAVAWTKTGAGTATTACTLYIEVNGTVHTIASGTSITMPSLTAGTDYAIWATTAGALQATNDFTNPPSANARKVGGFHYAPGGLATGTSGGDTTPQILAGTFWDLKFRPACSDPRGMKLVADAFWADLWMLNTDPAVNGTSKYGATIADGSSPPKVPSAFGGNGVTTYPDGNWWNMAECLRAYGKRLPTYSEFAALAYGTTEATSRGTDPGTCLVDAARTSQHVFQATGNLWTWGDEFGGGAAGAGWTANTGGRGSTYQMENAVLFGGSWGTASASGSRASSWGDSPTNSGNSVGARGVCDHLILD